LNKQQTSALRYHSKRAKQELAVELLRFSQNVSMLTKEVSKAAETAPS